MKTVSNNAYLLLQPLFRLSSFRKKIQAKVAVSFLRNARLKNYVKSIYSK